MSDETIEFVRKNEGYIYGSGAAGLLKAIKASLYALEGPRPIPALKVAEAIHSVLKEASRQHGQKPDIETFLREEGETGRKTYTVSWESGPYDWSIQASFVVMDATGRLCEPYYGFDLQLYDVE